MINSIQSYKPLYLKYRPQKLSQLVGQEFIVTTLTNALENNKLAHAYLFTGPRGTGKTSTARILAKSVNCISGPTKDPCNTCDRCVEIRNGSSTCVTELDAASNNSVDDARQLIEKAPLAVMGGNTKFYIIDECHMLSKEAFNALLKTIEEPPPNVIFILATTEEHKVPQTIISRCQKLSFRFISNKQLIEHLISICKNENIQLDNNSIELIAKRAQGGLRDALSMLDQASIFTLNNNKIQQEDLIKIFGILDENLLLSISNNILTKATDSLSNQLKMIVDDGGQIGVVANELLKHYLNLVKAYNIKDKKMLADIISGTQEYTLKLIEQAQEYELEYLIFICNELAIIEQELKRVPEPHIYFEIKLLAISYRLNFHKIDVLENRILELEKIINHEFISGNNRTYVRDKDIDNIKKTNKIVEESMVQSITQNNDVQEIESKLATNDDNVENHMTDDDIDTNNSTNINIETSDFWSKLLSQLQEKHIPTYSLLMANASLEEINDNELILSTVSSTFQKMIENKKDHIIGATSNILNRKPNLKVIIVDKKKNSEVKLQSSSPKAHNPIIEKKIDIIEELNNYSDNDDIIHLAYRLFEGPGSKQIG